MLANGLALKHISIHPRSLFCGNGYMQHTGREWRGVHDLKYIICFISVQNVLKDAIVVDYGLILTHPLALIQKDTASGSMGSSSCSSESIGSE